jgi:DNA-directed RNA polymerase I subunit RPA12
MFDSDIQFCPECGTIFPLPSNNENVTCMNKNCGFQVPVKAFENVVTSSEVVFNKNSGRKLVELPDEFGLGPMVDKICLHCGNDRMIYTTLQTRSADEGQTIFYLCPKCRFRDREDS